MKHEEPVRLLEGTQDALLRSALQAGRAELPEASRLAAIQMKVAAATAAGAVGTVATGLSAKVAGLVLAVGAAVRGGVAIRSHFTSSTEASGQKTTVVQVQAVFPIPTPAPTVVVAEPPAPAAAPPPSWLHLVRQPAGRGVRGIAESKASRLVPSPRPTVTRLEIQRR